MNPKRMLKVVVVVSTFLIFVLLQAYAVRPSEPTSQTETATETESRTEAETATETETGRQTVNKPKPKQEQQSPEETTSLSPDSDQVMAAQGLATLERIRSVPGAAPLVDEIVHFLQTNPYNEFSLDNLPENEEGLVEVNEETIRQMIKNDDIRAKWQKLMGLVAQYPEIVASITQQAGQGDQ